MKRALAAALTALLVAPSAWASGEAEPILSVADFNGSGRVNWEDVLQIESALLQGKYYAYYDRNADDVFDRADVNATWGDYGKYSTVVDQELAEFFDRFGWLQSQPRIVIEGLVLRWQLFTPALQGHGEHWVQMLRAMAAFEPDGAADPTMAQGLNRDTVRDEVAGLYWGEAATPLFEDPSDPSGLSTLGWPEGTAWHDKRVQAFADSPSQFTSSPHEFWHTHGGLCLTEPEEGNFIINQYLSNAECQALPNVNPQLIGFDEYLQPIYANIWVNVWMLHMWMFDLNPNGLFGGTHPDVDPQAPGEEIINGGREVPMWFQMRGHGH